MVFKRSSEKTAHDPPLVLLAVPLTERVSVGAAVPMPTSPVGRIVIRIELFVPNEEIAAARGNKQVLSTGSVVVLNKAASCKSEAMFSETEIW
jgi:hypothetical protein